MEPTYYLQVIYMILCLVRVNKLCRGVDQLYNIKSDELIRLFCIDINLDLNTFNKKTENLNRRDLYLQNLLQREKFKKRLNDPDFKTNVILEYDDQI